MSELISVIVPVYKVERYLQRCLNSILCQTYTDLEIILIDDGSPDQCGEICDIFANKDKRIRTVHKINGGLSEARNTGLDIATGKYIVFVDSDDYIESNMIEKLYLAFTDYDADMSICNFKMVDENGHLLANKEHSIILSNEVITGNEALLRLATPGNVSYVVAWNKMYSKVLFNDVRFPQGKIHEDEFVSHHLLGKCRKVACITDVGYNYVQRGGSIMATENLNARLDKAEALIDRAVYLDSKGLRDKASTIYYDVGMELNHDYKNDLSNTTKIKSMIRLFRRKYYLSGYCTFKQKLQLLIFCLSPNIFNCLIK